MFVYGDVVYAQTWQVLTLKNCMEAFSYDSNSLSCCIGPRFCSTVLYKFEQLAKIFWVNGLPPPWQKIARTPMLAALEVWNYIKNNNSFLIG